MTHDYCRVVLNFLQSEDKSYAGIQSFPVEPVELKLQEELHALLYTACVNVHIFKYVLEWVRVGFYPHWQSAW